MLERPGKGRALPCGWKCKLAFPVICTIWLLFLCVTELFNRKDTVCSLQQPHRPGGDCFPPNEQTFSPSVHTEEMEFPLAFSLVVYTDPERVFRLLRAIYRPHNYYCIHIDRKSPPHVVKAIERLRECPELAHNVYFVEPKDRVDVRWGFISVLDADLICARLLLTRAPRRWKYWINLTGQEFPLRTNWELVRALRLLNGSNIVEAQYRRRATGRYPRKKINLPEFTWYKGSVHVAVRREFVEYALNEARGKLLLDALRTYEQESGVSVMPEETFFATLNHNPNVFPIPGAFTGMHEEHVAIPLARAKIWRDSGTPCGSGHWRRAICIFGMADLPFLFTRPHFFANKFLPDVEPAAFDLLELWYAAKVNDEAAHGRLADSFNETYYRSLPYATQHL